MATQNAPVAGTVKVYHGTFAQAALLIYDEGLRPIRASGYVYVTTDYKAAKRYAWGWTGARIHARNEGHNNGADMRGAVCVARVKSDRLEVDDYNLEAEPSQYKIKGVVKGWGFDEIEFPEFSDPEVALYAACFFIGMARE